jgi:predicted DNA-binding ribbon-helix-helix protein
MEANMQIVKKQSVSLYPEDRKIVEKVAKKHTRNNNFSAALQIIIQEWDDMKKAQSAEQKPVLPTAE